jgi:hypothetical protein
MKYTFESSETEVTGLYGLLGLIAKEVGKTIRHANELGERSISGDQLTGTSCSPPEVFVDGQDSDGKDADILEFARAPVREKADEVEPLYATEPAPPPASVSKVDKAERKGRIAFDAFIQDWLVGINPETMALIEEVLQPDRAQMLRDLQNGPSGYGVLIFVKKCGGLQSAIAAVTGSESLALALAPYMVPPASIAFSELADTFEYANPFKKDED